jgi:histidinol-phosphate aminotransferase
MIGAAEMIAEINKIKLPYNINFFTEYTAALMLENAAAIKDTVSTIIGERDKLLKHFAGLPFENVYPSEANFILVRTSQKQNLFKHLKKDSILIRDVSSYHLLENCLRISVGTEEENLKLCESLDNFFMKGKYQ